MVLFHVEETAVTYMRAASNIKIRNNKYTPPDQGIDPLYIQFDTHLRSSGKPLHFRVTDTATTARRRYDLTLQVIEDEEQPADSSLSSSSQGTITSPTKVESESLIAKRHHEIRTYLRYIKNGHDTIKRLEAFHQYRDGDKLMMAQFFSICDAGNVKQLRMDCKAKRIRLPEMFMWKMYLQLIDALAFLHNDHPKYQNDPLHVNRLSILSPELGAENVYLAWPFKQPHDKCYPDVRLGDFSKALYVPVGEGVLQTEPVVDPKNRPPELNFISAKSDVWRAGSILLSLTKAGEAQLLK